MKSKRSVAIRRPPANHDGLARRRRVGRVLDRAPRHSKCFLSPWHLRFLHC